MREKLMTPDQKLRFAVVVTALAVVALAATCGSCMTPMSLSVAASEQTRTPLQQRLGAIHIETVCVYAANVTLQYGSGVVVGDHSVLTALHVVQCEQGGKPIITVDPGDLQPRLAVIMRQTDKGDIARLETFSDLSQWYVPVEVGEQPQLGERVCEYTASPSWRYRCGTTQALVEEASGDQFIFEAFIELGNSGSAVYDSHGRLVGILVMLATCQGGYQCEGAATLLSKYPELLE